MICKACAKAADKKQSHGKCEGKIHPTKCDCQHRRYGPWVGKA